MKESSSRGQHPLSDSGTEVVPTHNLVLQDLLSHEFASDLLTDSNIVSLKPNQVLYEQGDKIELIYFPLDCVVSNLAMMEDGTSMETSMVGRDGLVGISAILGRGFSKQWTWVLIGGETIQVEAKNLDKLLLRNQAALERFLSCYRSLVIQTSQRSVCNARHTLLERLCCWLLMLHDRVGDINLRLTQELIASRIGARRAGITVAAGQLQEIRAIEYRRGKLYIINRKALEAVVCECYSIMRAEVTQTEPL